MNELQRMEYLSAMDVSTFVPRWVLPGARLSVQASLPVATQVDLEQGDSRPSAAAVTPMQTSAYGASGQAKPEARRTEAAEGVLSDLLGSSLGGSPGQARVQKTASQIGQKVVVEESSDNLKPVRFSLNLWRINPALLVVDSHVPKAALPTVSLLRNILAAKQLRIKLPAADTLAWPMFKGHFEQGGWQGAREMVSAFMQTRLEQKPVKYVWLMGEDAFNAMAPSVGQYQQYLGKALDVPQLGCLALVMPSLTEMLQNPLSKKTAWQALCPYDVTP